MVKAALPNTSAHFDTPNVIYALMNPRGPKVFDKSVDKVDVKASFDNSAFPCDCLGSSFVNKDHNHIITGNLKIIDTNKLLNKLHNLFSKGLKYRENRIADYQKVKKK